MTFTRAAVLFAFAISTPLCAQTPEPKPSAAPVEAQARAADAQIGTLAPLPQKPSPVSSHAPFEAGDCKICHQNSDPKQPGPLHKQTPALCLDCHEEFDSVLKRSHTHPPARAACTTCHNPHN